MTTKSFSLMRLMQLCLLLAITSMAFTACDKDDDEDVASANGGDLIGRWELFYDMVGGEIDEYYSSGEYVIQFNADGTYYIVEDGYPEANTWFRQGDQLWIADDDPCTIVELTSTRLILDSYDGYDHYTLREVFRRIN